MKKFFSLLRAVMSQDMQIFKFKAKSNASNTSKLMFPLLLGLFVMYAIGSIYMPLATSLKEINCTYVVLEIAIIFPAILALLEGIYKSQGILFEAKDTELLFSLPIDKKSILIVRIIKLYVFQFLYSLLYIIPGIVVYAYLEKPDVYFYIISGVMVILFPIIPTIVGCAFGYLTKHISSKFKMPKIIQLIITFTIVSVIFVASFNSKNIIQNLVDNVSNVDSTIRNIYYPAGVYIDLINKFDIVKLLELLLINIALFTIFILVASKTYFNIISKSKDNSTRSSKKKKSIDELSFKKKGIISALIKKELSRYFSSSVYVFNTFFGMVLLLIATIALCTNFDSAIAYISSQSMPAEQINILHALAPKVFIAIVIAMSFMTSITSSSISLEGKSFNISKSLPIKEDKLLLAKVFMSDIITIPVIIICDIIFLYCFNVSILDSILLIISSFLAPTIAAVFGLIINLKYPKMDASSDTEVVKQSMSSMVAVFGGILLSGIFVVITFILAGFGDYAMILEVLILACILLLLWFILSKYGRKRYREIEV